MSWQPKKLVAAHLLSENDSEDGFLKGCALIRSNLGIDPASGSYEDWAAHYAQAIWLENYRLRREGELLAHVFGGESE